MPKLLKAAGHSAPDSPRVPIAMVWVGRHGAPTTRTAVIRAMVSVRRVVAQAGVAMTSRCHRDAPARGATQVAVAWTGALATDRSVRLAVSDRETRGSVAVAVISSAFGEIHRSSEIAGGVKHLTRSVLGPSTCLVQVLGPNTLCRALE